MLYPLSYEGETDRSQFGILSIRSRSDYSTTQSHWDNTAESFVMIEAMIFIVTSSDSKSFLSFER